MDAILVALLIGLAVGVVVGALGAGGGILSVPILVYALGQAPHSASASSLVIVGSTALAGLAHHIRRETVDWRTGLTFGLLGVAGSFLGSRLSVRVDGRVLMGLFAVMLAMVAVAMFRQAFITRRIERRRPGEPVATAVRRRPAKKWKWLPISALASATGLLTGFFGVGGGFVVVPVLVLVLGVPMRTASGTSLVVMVVASISGLLSRIGTDVVVDWPLTIAFTIASMIGGVFGGPAASRVKTWVLMVVFAVLLALVAVFVGVSLALGIAT